MKIIKCDVCGKELDFNEVHIISDFMEPIRTVDLCGKCLDVYRGMIPEEEWKRLEVVLK